MSIKDGYKKLWGLEVKHPKDGDRGLVKLNPAYITAMFLVRKYPVYATPEEIDECKILGQSLGRLPAKMAQSIWICHDLELMHRRRSYVTGAGYYGILEYFKAQEGELGGYTNSPLYLGSEPDTSYHEGMKKLALELYCSHYGDENRGSMDVAVPLDDYRRPWKPTH